MAQDEKDKIADALRALAGEDAHNEARESASTDGVDDLSRPPVVRPLTPHARLERPLRPGAPVRPPVPGAGPSMQVESIVPAQAPKPSLDPVQQAPTPQPEPVPEIVEDDDLVAVPAPSEEDLMAAAMRHTAPRHPTIATKPRSLTLQRTLIPILLTLALLMPAFGIWLRRRPAESELRLYGQRLLVYLIVGGAVFLILAIVNMFQVRGALRTRPSVPEAVR